VAALAVVREPLVVVRVLQGHVLSVLAGLPEKSVHVSVTSPPYWQLRAYGTEPQVWQAEDGDALCAPEQHEWGDEVPGSLRGGSGTPTDKNGRGEDYGRAAPKGAFCAHCHAWRGELGQEPTPELFVLHLVQVFRAVRRVLRDDGCLFVNIAGCYWSDPGGQNGSLTRTGGFRGVSNKAVEANRENGRKEKGRHPVYKPLDYVDIPGLVARALQEDGWLWRSDMALVKCLSGGTRLYARTAKGDMPVMLKDLVRLDPLTVKLWNGTKWTQVLAWTRHEPTISQEERHAASRRRINARQVGEEPAAPDYLEIEFRSGERVGCTPEHRWPTQRGVLEASDLRVGDVVPTVRLPEPEEAQRPRALDDEDIGWFVGFYLAEGYRDPKTIKFAMHRKETAYFDRIKRIAGDFHGSATWQTPKGQKAITCVYGRLLHAVLDTYISGSGAKQKHLTNACWERSDVFLRALLQGYLDGDGHWREGDQMWTLGFASNDELASDLRTLASRLGMRIGLKRAVAKLNGNEYPTYRGWLRPAEGASKHSHPRSLGEVVAIRASRARVFWDVTVEDEPHLFALASGLLTHNSAPMPESVSGTRWERCRVRVGAGSRAPEVVYSGSAYGSAPQSAPRGPNSKFEGPTNTEWADCPGCARCEKNDGLVLRRGSGRPTRAWERLLVFAKKAPYFWDVEAVREKEAPSSASRYAYAAEDGRINKGGAYREAFEDGNETLAGRARTGMPQVPTDGRRNARDWFLWRPQPLKDEHYAAYPTTIPEFAIKAGSSERGCCPACGAPWARVVERRTWPGPRTDPMPQHLRSGRPPRGPSDLIERPIEDGETTTLGWRPTCSCARAQPPVPCRVLDPFGGSGTTGIAADRLGRDAILVELKPSYAELARRRLTRDAPLLMDVSLEGADTSAPSTPEPEPGGKQASHPNRTVRGFNQRWAAKQLALDEGEAAG
jgi:hypothetical protein